MSVQLPEQSSTLNFQSPPQDSRVARATKKVHEVSEFVVALHPLALNVTHIALLVYAVFMISKNH